MCQYDGYKFRYNLPWLSTVEVACPQCNQPMKIYPLERGWWLHPFGTDAKGEEARRSILRRFGLPDV